MKLYIIFTGLTIASFFVGKTIADKKCESKLEAQKSDFQIEVEKTNNKSNQVVIKAKNENAKIKNTISHYDSVQRVRLLAQIEDFEAGK